MTSAGWPLPTLATFDSATSASTSSVSRSASATIAPDEVDRFTPGGIGATLSPTSAIFLTTTPANGARITVFCSCASAKARSAWACASCASAILTRLAAASRWSTATIFWLREVLRQPELALVLGEVGLGALHGARGRATEAS